MIRRFLGRNREYKHLHDKKIKPQPLRLGFVVVISGSTHIVPG